MYKIDFFFSFFEASQPFNYQWKFICFLIHYSQIPPAPPKPDFDSPRDKMHKLGEGEATMTKEEYTKMKQELEAWVRHSNQKTGFFFVSFYFHGMLDFY